MRSALLDFREGIHQLQVFLDRTKSEQEFIALLNEAPRRAVLQPTELALLDKLLQAATNTKQYIYIVSIVSIYGLLERFVDSVIARFVLGLQRNSPTFNDLPEKVRDNHLPFSLALTDAVMRDKFRDGQSPNTIISNLHSCLSNSSSYTLNGEAYALHRGNVNLDRIGDMLNGTGVHQHLRRILKTQSFQDFLNTLDSANKPAKTDEEVRKVFASIDQLVDRRNEVSHGVVDNLESIELLLRRCEFVYSYGQALYEIMEHEILKHAAISGAAENIGMPVAVFNNEVVCFEAKFEIAVGDRVFMLTNDMLAPVRTSLVKSLQIDKTDTQKVAVDPTKKFGAKVEFHASMDTTYHLFRSI